MTEGTDSSTPRENDFSEWQHLRIMKIGVLIGSVQPVGLKEKTVIETPYGQPSSPIF